MSGVQNDRPPATLPHGPARRRQMVPRQLPAAAAHFVGRAAELKALSALLGQGPGGSATVAISVISGTAGIGKTALAVQWAHQVTERFPDGQLYADLRGFSAAGSPASPAEVLRGFLAAFGMPPEQNAASLDSLLGLYRSQLYRRRVLVLLDNARDAAQVRPLLPGGAGCAAVVTSRSQLTGLVAADGAAPLMLDVLTGSESRELLQRRLGAERLAGEEAAAEQLASLCARLPLALSITAARAAAQPRARLAVLASELDAAAARLEERNAPARDPASSIRAALSWAYASLGADAGRMFRLLALHPGPDIGAPAAASLAGVSQQQAAELLRALTGASLITERAPGRFTFHDLVRSYATERVRADQNEGERQAAFHRVLDHYLHTASAAAALSHMCPQGLKLRSPRQGSFPEQLADGEAALAWFTAERENLRAAIARAAADGFDAHAWQIACTMAPFMSRSGGWHQQEWSTTLAAALSAARRHGNVSGQARVHWEFGLVRIRLARYDDALSHLSLALGLYRRLGDVPGQAHVHLGLGQMFSEQHQWADALQHAERALDLFREARDHLGQGEALNDASWYSAMAGDHQQALSYCQQALEQYQEFGSRPREVATVLIRLGDTMQAAGDPGAARNAWEQALAIVEETSDPGADEVRSRLREAGG